MKDHGCPLVANMDDPTTAAELPDFTKHIQRFNQVHFLCVTVGKWRSATVWVTHTLQMRLCTRLWVTC